MHMPGGGVLRVGAGQITDDSELALCLAHALVATGQAHDHNPRKLQSSAADMYIEWLNSEPFDLGKFFLVSCTAALLESQETYAYRYGNQERPLWRPQCTWEWQQQGCCNRSYGQSFS